MPSFFPSLIPIKDNAPVIIPIIIAGYQMFTSRIARLNPTARASILVAMLSSIRVDPFDGSGEDFSSFLSKPEIIILTPTNPRRARATQWS